MDGEELTVENALFYSFESMIRTQLDPVWHRVSSKTKQLVTDTKTLRKLLTYLTSYDPVTFYSFLETIRAASKSGLTSIHKNASSWLMIDSADVLFSIAKERVYTTLDHQLKPVLEELPKWKVVHQVLCEVYSEKKESDKVLIMMRGVRATRQLKEVLSTASLSLKGKSKFVSRSSEALLTRLLQRYSVWKSGLNSLTETLSKQNQPAEMLPEPGRGQPSNKRRRVRGSASATLDNDATQPQQTLDEQVLKQMTDLLDDDQESESVETTQWSLLTIQSYYSRLDTLSVPGVTSQTNEDDDFKLLMKLKPEYIIMYDPDMAFIRRIEVYKSLHPDLDVHVYFLVYDQSIEEQQYLTTLRREKDAFEKLIHQKSNMVIPMDQDGKRIEEPEDIIRHSRFAGGQSSLLERRVIVDVREFRTSLPLLLNKSRIRIVPCTLEVGDYVLSPRICVERKAIPDLVSSLKNGRLYSQCESMSLHYDIPLVLIEFEQSRAFALQSNFVLRQDISASDISSRLVLLILHFPKVGFIWTCSPSQTSLVFEDLKANEPEPDQETAMAIGASSTAIDSVYSVTPYDLLRSLPGINAKNVSLVFEHAKNIRELSEWPLELCTRVLGLENGRKLHGFIHCSTRK